MLEDISPYPYNYLLSGLLILAAPLLVRLATSSSSSASSSSEYTMASPPGVPDHTVVVLGAGFVGVPMAHHLLKHTPADVVNLHVVLVAPNDAMFWNAAAPRGFLPVDDNPNNKNPKGTPGFGDDKLFTPLAPAFAKYNKGSVKKFEQLIGRATSLDPDRQTVDVTLLAGGQIKTIHYDTVLIATGSDMANGMPFKVVPRGGTAETKAALAEYRARVRTASHIVVAGGGMTGVEVAGELGSAFGTKVASAKDKKDIVLVINEPLPLGVYGTRDSVRQAAADRLTSQGVRIVADTRVTESTPAGGDGSQTVLTLTAADGKMTTLPTDLYIPALGISFNSQFLPEAMLDTSATGRRRIRTRATLQAEGYDSIFVAGDAANLQVPSIKNADSQIQVLSVQMQTYLRNWAAEATGDAKKGAAGAGAEPVALKEYPSGEESIMLAVSTGPGGGTGQLGTWKMWSLLVWYFKARYLGTDKMDGYVTGQRTLSNNNW